MRDVARFGTVICFTAIIASMGGYEHGKFSLVGMFIRIAVFAVLMGISIVADDILTQRKKALRAGTHKAKKNNKYQLICHK